MAADRQHPAKTLVGYGAAVLLAGAFGGAIIASVTTAAFGWPFSDPGVVKAYRLMFLGLGGLLALLLLVYAAVLWGPGEGGDA